MNNTRRKELARAKGLILDAQAIIELCKDEEEEYKENMPESLQSGDKGDQADNAISELDNALISLEDAISSIDNAQE